LEIDIKKEKERIKKEWLIFIDGNTGTWDNWLIKIQAEFKEKRRLIVIDLDIEYTTTIEAYTLEITHKIEVEITNLDIYYTTTIKAYEVTITHNIEVQITKLDLEYTTYIDQYIVSIKLKYQ